MESFIVWFMIMCDVKLFAETETYQLECKVSQSTAAGSLIQAGLKAETCLYKWLRYLFPSKRASLSLL